MSAADSILGPRNGDIAGAGGYVFAALAAKRVINLSEYRGKYIKLKWKPVADELVLFGFYASEAAADAATLDATTTQADHPALLPHAADWLSAGIPLEHVQVPFDAPFIQVIPSTGSGRLTIRLAEQGPRDVTP